MIVSFGTLSLCLILAQFDESVHILRFILLLYFPYSIYQLHKTTRYVSCIMYFLAGFFLFNLSRVYLSLFDNSLLYASDKYVFYDFSDSTINKVLSLLLASLSSVILGYIINQTSKIRIPSSKSTLLHVESKQIVDIIKIFLYISLPCLIFKGLWDLWIIKQYGYLILFMDPPRAPWIIRAGWGFFSIVFPLLFVFSPTKKQFFKYLIFFIVVSLPSFAMGSRSTVLRPMLFFLWFYYNSYSRNDISIKKILYIIAGVSVFAEIMLVYRSGGEFAFDFLMMLYLLLRTQGVTYVLIGNCIDYAHQFVNQSNLNILFPLVSSICWFFVPEFRLGHSIERVSITLSLDDQLMYAVNPDMYLEGSGYGSSYIAELYRFGGYFAVIVGSYLFGRFMFWFESNFNHSLFLKYFAWTFIPSIIWMSRGSFLFDPFLICLGYLFFLVIKFFVRRNIQFVSRYK